MLRLRNRLRMPAWGNARGPSGIKIRVSGRAKKIGFAREVGSKKGIREIEWASTSHMGGSKK